MALSRFVPQIITLRILICADLSHKIIIICATKQQAPFTPIYQVLPCNIDDRPDVCSTIHERDAPHVLVVAARRPPTCLSASPDICVRATISGTISFLLACAYVRVSTPRTHVCVPWICLTSPYETLFFGFSSAQILSNKSFQFARWSSKQVLASNCNVPSCNTDDRPDWRYTIHENNVPHVLVFLVRASFCPNRRMHHCVFRHDVRTSVCATTMSRLDTHLQGVATPPVPCLMLQRACKSLTLVPPVFGLHQPMANVGPTSTAHITVLTMDPQPASPPGMDAWALRFVDVGVFAARPVHTVLHFFSVILIERFPKAIHLLGEIWLCRIQTYNGRSTFAIHDSSCVLVTNAVQFRVNASLANKGTCFHLCPEHLRNATPHESSLSRHNVPHWSLGISLCSRHHLAQVVVPLCQHICHKPMPVVWPKLIGNQITGAHRPDHWCPQRLLLLTASDALPAS